MALATEGLFIERKCLFQHLLKPTAEAVGLIQRQERTSGALEGAEKGNGFRQAYLIEESMRGDEEQQEEMFSYGSLNGRVPMEHPLRAVRVLADEAMRALEPRFAEMYSVTGRPSIPPEQMLRALLLQMLYSVRSERMLMEQMEYNLLFRWFVGLSMNEPVWNPSSFSKNRERLLTGTVAQSFFAAVVASARRRRLMHDEHFTVDGTLIEAWAAAGSGQWSSGQSADGRHARIQDRSGCAVVSQRHEEWLEAATHGPCGEREPARSGGGHGGQRVFAEA